MSHSFVSLYYFWLSSNLHDFLVIGRSLNLHHFIPLGTYQLYHLILAQSIFIFFINRFNWLVVIIFFPAASSASLLPYVCCVRWGDWILLCVTVWIITVRFIWYQETFSCLVIYVFFLYNFFDDIWNYINSCILLI